MGRRPPELSYCVSLKDASLRMVRSPPRAADHATQMTKSIEMARQKVENVTLLASATLPLFRRSWAEARAR